MIQIMPEQSVRKLDLGALTVSSGPNEQAPDHNLAWQNNAHSFPLNGFMIHVTILYVFIMMHGEVVVVAVVVW